MLSVAAAVTAMLGLATQIVAAAFGYHPGLGDPFATMFGVRLYAPWQVLVWTLDWLLRDLGVALILIMLVGLATLAAFGAAALLAAIEPTSLVLRLPRGHFERWAKLGDYGLLRDDGLALGAVARHVLARSDFVRSSHGNVLMLGDPAHSDAALIAAVSCWRGALVVVEARDVSSRLGRADVVRFAPGRADGVAINPLLGVRGGAHAWSDAMTLARAFMRSSEGMLVASFAALVLDTLAHARPEARSFAGMRQALADPPRRLAELCARWAEGASDLGPATGELQRVARYWRADGHAALRMMRDIDIALRLFADGDHAVATEAHQLRLADLVSGDGPTTLVIQMTPGKEREASASLVSALLAQLVAACAPSADLDQLGRVKQRDLLLVIEADALDALTAVAPSSAPARLPKQERPPLMDGPMALAHERGLRVLTQARCIADAAAMIGADDESLDGDLSAAFSLFGAIGPQTEASAKALAERAGTVEHWRRWPGDQGMIARWLLPYWERGAAWSVAPGVLRAATASEGLLLFDELKPIWCRTLTCDAGKSAFVAAAALPHAPHDWDGPSLPPAVQSKSAALAAPPQQPALALGINGAAPVSATKLRRALARRSAPELTSSQPRGERLL